MGQWEIENLDKRSRHPDDARTKFEKWILSNGGTNGVSKMLDVHQVTVVTWISRRSIPSTVMTAKILKAAEGELTIEDIIQGTKQ